MSRKLWLFVDCSNLAAIPLDLFFFVITRQKFQNFSKNFEKQKFPRWLTSSQKNKHQFSIKNLMFLSHNHTPKFLMKRFIEQNIVVVCFAYKFFFFFFCFASKNYNIFLVKDDKCIFVQFSLLSFELVCYCCSFSHICYPSSDEMTTSEI